MLSLVKPTLFLYRHSGLTTSLFVAQSLPRLGGWLA
jgi:hypothetical protein